MSRRAPIGETPSATPPWASAEDVEAAVKRAVAAHLLELTRGRPEYAHLLEPARVARAVALAVRFLEKECDAPPPAAVVRPHGGRRVGKRAEKLQKKFASLSQMHILPGMTPVQLVQLREHLGWSVKQMAEYLGVHFVTVYGWENGKRQVSQRRVRLLLQDLWDKAFGEPWDRERARAEVSKRLGVDADRAGQLLVEYGRLPGEPWRDVVGRVVDGERNRTVERAARS
jgi:transcriptional regulator with XRE-family HTH domain